MSRAILPLAAGLLRQVDATSHPSVEEALRDAAANYQTHRVVHSGRVIASCGPGTALEFALEILRFLGKNAAADRLQMAMLISPQ